MRLNILAIGKAKHSQYQKLSDDFLRRLPFFGTLKEFESNRPAGPERTKDEARQMKKWLDAQASHPYQLICLDPSGPDTSSEKLAAIIEGGRIDGISACYFAIGGADGHGQDMLDASHRRIAFGRAIWPHMLCRLMLAEQLYRAEMIISGHPYHRALSSGLKM